jgi:3-carboxy-cis,cis-muconate cycloisomerase
VQCGQTRTAPPNTCKSKKALAIVQGRLGIIPQEAADEIARNCDIDKIDMDKLRAQTERIGYPILGVVSQLNALCRNKLGEYCHWGATTQDITDTATVIQIRDALDLVEDDLKAISASLASLARRYRDTPVAGRSNLQQAIPTTFGYKMATILAAVHRHRERLDQLRPRVLVGEFGGACGTLASVEKDAMEMQAALMAELRLGQPDIAWHTVRDCIAEVGWLPRSRGRHARQARPRREADDANRSRRSFRAVRSWPVARAARCRRSAIPSPPAISMLPYRSFASTRPR